jgi:hypothetical protein
VLDAVASAKAAVAFAEQAEIDVAMVDYQRYSSSWTCTTRR